MGATICNIQKKQDPSKDYFSEPIEIEEQRNKTAHSSGETYLIEKNKWHVKEKLNEPSPFFHLKNSEEQLWQDQSGYLNNVALSQLRELSQEGNLSQAQWEGFNISQPASRYHVEINLLQTNDLSQLKEFEDDFYYRKRINQRLTLLKNKVISEDFHALAYEQQIFMSQNSYCFLRVGDYSTMTLRQIINIRKQKNQYYTEDEIATLMLMLLNAVKEAESVDTSHGGITDEKVYITNQGEYKLKGFSEVCIKKRVNQKGLEEKQKWFDRVLTIESPSPNLENNRNMFQFNDGFSSSPDTLRSNWNDEEELGEEQILKTFILSHAFIQYHAYKYKPRDCIFWSQDLLPLFKKGMKLYYKDQAEIIKFQHEPEDHNNKKDEFTAYIKNMLLKQDIYSIGMLALAMMTLGEYEKFYTVTTIQQGSQMFTRKRNGLQKVSLTQYQFPEAFSSLARSFFGNKFLYQQEMKQMMKGDKQEALSLLDKYIHPQQEEIFSFIDQYQERYPRITKVIKALIHQDPKSRPDLNMLVQRMSAVFDEQNPEDDEICKQNKLSQPQNQNTLIDEIITSDADLFQPLALKNLQKEEAFFQVRKLYYKIQGCMIIRNYRLALRQIEDLDNLLETQEHQLDFTKLKYYGIENSHRLYLTEIDELLIIFMKGFCYLQRRSLSQAKETFRNLDSQILDSQQESLQTLNSQITRFYQGLISYYSDATQDAFILFNRVLDMSKGKLREQDPKAYFKLTMMLIHIYQDLHYHHEAFTLLEEQMLYHEAQEMKFNYLSFDLLFVYFNFAKILFDVKEFEQSRSFLEKTNELLKSQQDKTYEMRALRLRTLGYLSYLSLIFNEMKSLNQTLSESVSILNGLLRREKFLETIIIWLNQFGFLLITQFSQEEFLQFIDIVELTIQKNEKNLNIDLFFKNYVFAKLYYHCKEQKKSQEIFLYALEMHHYFVVDDLNPKQSVNVSMNQVKQLQQERIKRLDHQTHKQQQGGTTLPPPDKDNLTIRILIEIYDWLGYLFTLHRDYKKADICLKYWTELQNNIEKLKMNQ